MKKAILFGSLMMLANLALAQPTLKKLKNAAGSSDKETVDQDGEKLVYAYYKILTQSRDNYKKRNELLDLSLKVKDSALYYYELCKKNPKKYPSADLYIRTVEEYAAAYEQNFFNPHLGEVTKSMGTGANVAGPLENYWSFEFLKEHLANVEGLFLKKEDVTRLNNKIVSSRKDYVQFLVANKKIACPEQFEAQGTFIFAPASINSCSKSQTEMSLVPGEEGIKLYLFSTKDKYTFNSVDFYLNGKRLSIAGEMLKNDSDFGWYSKTFLPTVQHVEADSYFTLDQLVKAGVRAGDTISLEDKYNGIKGQFIFKLPAAYKDVNAYLAAVKEVYLKSKKPFFPAYKNAALEKEVLAAYESYQSKNPQHKIGKVVKVFVSGDDWESKKLYNGNPDYQRTNVYFLVKGDDGLAYYVKHGIRKNYDIATKKYGGVFIYDLPVKEEVHPDLLK